MMSQRRGAALLSVAGLGALLCGCSGDSPSDVLHDTAANLSTIHSGRLSLRITMSTRDGKDVGFAIDGPFSQTGAGGLPVLALRYSRIDGTATEVDTVVSTGHAAYSVAGGRTYRLSSTQLASLRQGGAAAGLGDLHPDRWLTDPRLSRGQVGGVSTDRLTGRVQVLPLLEDLLSVLAGSGANATSLSSSDATTLQRAVSSAIVAIDTGHDDRLLRRLAVAVDLGHGSAPAGSALAGLDLVHLRLSLGLDAPNSPITVSAPRGADSAEQLTSTSP